LRALQSQLLKWTAPEQQRSQKPPTCFNAGAAVHSATSKVNTCGLFLDKLALDRVGKKRRGDRIGLLTFCSRIRMPLGKWHEPPFLSWRWRRLGKHACMHAGLTLLAFLDSHQDRTLASFRGKKNMLTFHARGRGNEYMTTPRTHKEERGLGERKTDSLIQIF